jgi:4-methyl-5(b-hydroxyethyl)-thiazole monophosphate biosynthesis
MFNILKIKKMKKILVFLATGFEEIEAITPIDVWRRAGFEVKTISVTGEKTVTGSHGISIVADSVFEKPICREADLLFLPGGMPGSANLDKHEGLRSVIHDFYNEGKYLTAICAAPFVLGHNGILKNKTATCYPGYEKELIGANVTGNSIEKDGKIITGKGPGVAMQFALEVVSVLKSNSDADKLADQMQVVL